jgi:hypothetical protein
MTFKGAIEGAFAVKPNSVIFGSPGFGSSHPTSKAKKKLNAMNFEYFFVPLELFI